MDSDSQTTCAQQQDPDFAARVVRNIGQIEQDSFFAWGPLSERLIREISVAIRKAVPEPWVVVSSEWDVSFTSPDWRSNTVAKFGDAWLELGEICDDEEEHSWVAAAVGAGPTSMCLELKFRKGLTPAAEALTAKDKPLANVLKEGFKRDDTGTRIVIPVPIDAEALARGFELNDLDEALGPLTRAVELAIKAKPDLDVLVEHVRAQAGRK